MRDDKSEGWETLKTKHSQIRKVSLGDIYIDPRFQGSPRARCARLRVTRARDATAATAFPAFPAGE